MLYEGLHIICSHGSVEVSTPVGIIRAKETGTDRDRQRQTKTETDEAVESKKSSIEATQILRVNQTVLINESHSYQDQTDPAQKGEPEVEKGVDEHKHHQDMQPGGNLKRPLYAHFAG